MTSPLHQSINRFTYLVPPYLKLKVQVMKVVLLDLIACTKASIDVVGWNVSLSSVKVSCSVMASVVVLIFVEVAVRIGMPSFASVTSYARS